MKDCSIDLSTVRGKNREATWITHTPGSWCRLHCEPGLARELFDAQSTAEEQNTWMMDLIPSCEPVLLQKCGPGEEPSLAEWFLVLGVVERTAVCCWPVENDATFDLNVLFSPSVAAGTQCTMLHVLNLNWNVWNAEWRSPWQQRCLYNADASVEGPNARLRLVGLTPQSEPLPKASARFGFRSASEPIVRRLAKFCNLVEILAIKDKWEFLEAMVRHWQPQFSNTEVYIALLERLTTDAALDSLVESDDVGELFEADDRERLHKHREEAQQRKKDKKAFFKGTQRLRGHVKGEQQVLVDAMDSDQRRRGPQHYMGADDSAWTQALVSCWLPPTAHVLRDMINLRWRVTWAFGNISRSFGLYGYQQAALIVLRACWASYSMHTGVRCTIPGLESAAPDGAEEAAAAGPEEAADGAIGRGRGAAGRGGGVPGRGRGLAEGEAVEPIAADADPPAAGSRSSSSDSSSSSSSDSSDS